MKRQDVFVMRSFNRLEIHTQDQVEGDRTQGDGDPLVGRRHGNEGRDDAVET